MGLYDTQVVNQGDKLSGFFGRGQMGQGPGGQFYNAANPVVSTTSGVRPAYLVNQVKQPTIDPISLAQQQRQQTPVWRRPAGVTPSEWTYANTGGQLGTQPAAQQGGQIGNYNTGITAGTMPAGAVSQAFGRMGMSAVPGVDSQAGGQLQGMFGDLMSQGMNRIGTEFGRDAAFDTAGMNLAQQRARADAGLGYGNLLARLFDANQSSQNSQQNQLGSFLMSLLG